MFQTLKIIWNISSPRVNQRAKWQFFTKFLTANYLRVPTAHWTFVETQLKVFS